MTVTAKSHLEDEKLASFHHIPALGKTWQHLPNHSIYLETIKHINQDENIGVKCVSVVAKLMKSTLTSCGTAKFVITEEGIRDSQ
eukprot:GHVL01039312.1.p1 GENE.GHVL01039312.1~~GHVL01039312.1.p1  ORF type:complete len:100 (+),score=20.55 GHVL01039312.1:47-301(+)